MMQYKLVIIILLSVYIFSGYFNELNNKSDNEFTMQLQEEIYIDDEVMNVFEKKSIDDVAITDKKIKAWIIQIKYNEDNVILIEDILRKNRYKLKRHKSKMILSVGPYADISQAKEESNKLKKVLGIDNKITSFIF